ncbi:hypothetical protein C8F01DRAFT_1060629 [Mycena amicta]|nr:hypothetical protein C8F01DRAFT_1060629 [Mycena amicta]
MPSRTFWDLYPNFDHDPAAPLRAEFNRLAREENWGKATRKEEWGRCGQMEFERYFGVGGAPELAAWQAMVAFCGFKKVPQSVKESKRILRSNLFVNIFDMLDAKRTGCDLKKHASRDTLREYSLAQGKIFPKKRAKKNAFLKVLLIDIYVDGPPGGAIY